MLNFLVGLYLRFCLFVGCHRHVCRLVNEWVGSPLLTQVAWKMQLRLFDLGYHCCSSCYLATEKPNEHIEVKGSWCYKQSFPQCPDCYQPWEEGTECANCKINRQIEQERNEDYYHESLKELEQKKVEEDARYQEAVDADFDSRWEETERQLDDLARRICDPNCQAQGGGCNCAEEDDTPDISGDVFGGERIIRGGFVRPDDEEE